MQPPTKRLVPGGLAVWGGMPGARWAVRGAGDPQRGVGSRAPPRQGGGPHPGVPALSLLLARTARFCWRAPWRGLSGFGGSTSAPRGLG